MNPQRRRSRQTRACALLAAAGFLALAGCTGANPDNDNPPGTGDSTATTGSTEKVNLEFWTNLTVQAQSDKVQQQVEACLQEPELAGVTAKFDIVPLNAMQTRLSTLASSGNLPNVMQVTSNAVALAQSLDAIVPVDDLLAALGGPDNFQDSTISPVTREGHTYAIPDYVTHQAVYYRKDLFAAAGITEVPKSWDELLEAAQKVHDPGNGIYGFGVPLGAGNATAQYTLFQVLYSEGVYVFDPETGEYVFDNDNLEPVADAIQYLVDLYKAVSPPASSGWGLADQRTAYVQGQVAMTSEWGAVIGQAVDANPGLLKNIGMFPFPGPDASKEAEATFGDSYNFTVGKGSDAEIAASKALVECLSTAQSSAERALTRPVFAQSAVKGGRTVPDFVENQYIKQFSDIVSDMEASPFTTWYRYGLEHEMTPMASQIEYLTFIPENLQKAAAGQISAMDAAQAINEQLRSAAVELKLIDE